MGTAEEAPLVYARTDGNAFFVEEVLRQLAQPGPHVVPESVWHTAGVRLSRMGDDANALIVAAGTYATPPAPWIRCRQEGCGRGCRVRIGRGSAPDRA